jgi:hypothetical protein
MSTSALLTVQTGQPKLGVMPETVSGTAVGSVALDAAKSGNNPGCMDSTPTEAEVQALQSVFVFDSADNVLELDLLLSVMPTQTSGVQCVLARINGFDEWEDAAELALHGDCTVVLPNVPTRIVSPVPITRVTVVGVQSGVTSAVYTGARLFMKGRA